MGWGREMEGEEEEEEKVVLEEKGTKYGGTMEKNEPLAERC